MARSKFPQTDIPSPCSIGQSGFQTSVRGVEQQSLASALTKPFYFANRRISHI